MIAPSLSDWLRSTIASTSTVDTRPIPSHSGHMPCGSLNENRLEWPTCGSPSRLKISRSIEYASVAVPTVEREFAAHPLLVDEDRGAQVAQRVDVRPADVAA